MNNTNCIQPDKIFFENTLQPILHILVFIVGVVLNVWGLKSLLHDWKNVRSINILVLNLGLADMLYLLTLPFLIVYYLKGAKWIFGEAFCMVTRFCFNLNLYCSIGFLTCISVYRYLAIVYPIRALGKLTMTHTVVISAMVWILVSVQSLPDMTFPKSSVNKTEECFETTDWEHAAGYLNYSLGWTFTGFCIPFIIILGCYIHVTVVICRSHMMKKNKKQQVLKLLVSLILLFSLCFAPYHVFKNLNLYSRVLKNRNICSKWNSAIFVAHQASRGLVSLNSALNPLVYLNVNKDMGFQFRQLLQGCQQKISCLLSNSHCVPASQTEQEIDNPSMTADVF